jgi:hypothetical protein
MSFSEDLLIRNLSAEYANLERCGREGRPLTDPPPVLAQYDYEI